MGGELDGYLHGSSGMLRNANWKGGLMWGVLMLGTFSFYQIYFKNMEADIGFWAMQLSLWTVGGMFFAIFTGRKSKK